MFLFCATDAGGARELIPVIELAKRRELPHHVLSSPVTKPIFARADIPAAQHYLRSIAEAEEILESTEAKVLLMGTTGVPGNERLLTASAKKRNIPTLAVLDEWYGYANRFADERGKLAYLPDCICVQDELSQALAQKEGLPAKILRITGSPSLAELARHARLFAKRPPVLPEVLHAATGRPTILFLSDILRVTFGGKPGERGLVGTYLGYDEESVRQDLAEILRDIGRDVFVLEKLHPSEEPKPPPVTGKNVEWQVLSSAHPLWPLAWHADVILGMSTKALLEAAFLGRKPISYQPDTLVDPNLCTAVRFGLAELFMEKHLLAERLPVLLRQGRVTAPSPSLACADPVAAENVLAVAEQLLRKPIVNSHSRSWLRETRDPAPTKWCSYSHGTFSDRPTNIEGEKISLRPLTLEHATEEYASWINDPEVNKYLDTRSATIPELQEFIGRYVENESALLLGIFWKENGEHIGNVKLEPIAWEAGEAEMGIMIGNKTYWGRGAATEATDLVTRYAFGDLGLRAVTLGVVPGHKAALRVYEKCGFTIDRIEKDAVHHGGTPPSRIVMRKTAPPPPAV